ncbi:hypothetical protein [Bacillus sp. T3]|uniref:hypothetical protein n=1 Tax=Bacillus sp. T3 TaxID=467262 RepID=UPI002981F1E0|nr:hypothetical protein [Bacillus sp. T3]
MYYYGYGFDPMHPNTRDSEIRNVKGACQKFMNYHVLGQMTDGTQVEGIIEDMDNENVTMLVPEMVEEEVHESPESRVYGDFGYYGGGYGGGRRRYRRFRRCRLPIRFLFTHSLSRFRIIINSI